MEFQFNITVTKRSADAMHGDISRLSSGCDAYLSKPIDAELLLNMVADHINGRPQANSKQSGIETSTVRPLRNHQVNRRSHVS